MSLQSKVHTVNIAFLIELPFCSSAIRKSFLCFQVINMIRIIYHYLSPWAMDFVNHSICSNIFFFPKSFSSTKTKINNIIFEHCSNQLQIILINQGEPYLPPGKDKSWQVFNLTLTFLFFNTTTSFDCINIKQSSAKTTRVSSKQEIWGFYTLNNYFKPFFF